jgi:hypothetical protein
MAKSVELRQHYYDQFDISRNVDSAPHLFDSIFNPETGISSFKDCDGLSYFVERDAITNEYNILRLNFIIYTDHSLLLLLKSLHLELTYCITIN